MRKRKKGIKAPLDLSPEMADLLGEDRLPRTQVKVSSLRVSTHKSQIVKSLWQYIKENDLQVQISHEHCIILEFLGSTE